MTRTDCRLDRGRHVGIDRDLEGRTRSGGSGQGDRPRRSHPLRRTFAVGGQDRGRQQRPPVDDLLDELLLDIGAEIVDFTAAHVDAATDAFLRYGKGRHPAALNYGDCMAYAIARVAGCPLLYKGEDFARTDVRRAG